MLSGVVLLDEHPSRPAWRVGVALLGVGLTFVGAVVTCLARGTADRDPAPDLTDVPTETV